MILSFLSNRRQRTDFLVQAAFLWAPAWIIAGLMIGTRWAVIAGFVIGAAPFAAVMAVPWFVAVKEGSPMERLIAVAILGVIIAIAATLGWSLPSQEHS